MARPLIITALLLSVLVMAPLPTLADTGYSNLFTIDLRDGSGSDVALSALDVYRSPTEIDLKPHDTAYCYYSLTRSDGSGVTGGSLEYPVFIDGSAAPSAAYSWAIASPGVAKLTLIADRLHFSGASDVLSFQTGSGVMTVGGEPVTVATAPPSIRLHWSSELFVDEWDLFAALSAGATGTLGASGSVAGVEASIGAAKLSLSGSAGMGIHLTLESDESLSLARRTEIGLAASLKIPTISGKLGPGEISVTGLSAGADRGFSYEQAFRYRGSDLDSDEAKMMHAAFFLEAASAGGIVGGVMTGTVIKATVATLNGLSGADDLLDESLEAQTVGTSLGGSFSLGSVSADLSTPNVEADGQSDGPKFGFGFSGASFSGALSSEVSTLYGSGGAGSAPVGWENSARYGLSGDISAFDYTGLFSLGVVGVNGYSADLTRTLSLNAQRQPTEVSLSWRSQSGQNFDIGLYRQQDFSGDNVTVSFSDQALAQDLVGNNATGLRALKGDGIGTAVFGKTAVLGSLGEMKDVALDWAGTARTAYTISTGKTNGRVVGGALDVSIPVVPPAVTVDLGLDLEYQHFRSVPVSERLAVTGGEDYWELLENSTTPDRRDADSIVTILNGRVFSGLGPLVREAFLNLISLDWWPPFGKTLVTTQGQTEMVVRDKVRDRETGSVGLDDRYLDYTGSIISGDPSRLEVRGAGGAKRAAWGYSTRRVTTNPDDRLSLSDMRAKALSGNEILTLVGQFIEINLETPAGQAVTQLSPSGQMAIHLYQDQFDEMGADWSQRNATRIFRFNPDTKGWDLVGGSVSGASPSVSVSINRTGTYAPGIVTTTPSNDSDGDGLTDAEEDRNGNGTVDAGESDPFVWDSDGDGVGDGDEVDQGSDPLDSDSTPNRAPVLAFIGNRSVGIGSQMILALVGIDPDDDAVRFDATGLPNGATLNSTTGLLRWTPSAEGRWSVTVTVTDIPTAGSGPALTDSETFLLIAEPQAPSISEAGDNLYFISAAAHATGVAGSSWVSDVAVFNVGESPANVNLYLLPSGENNSTVRGRAADVLAGAMVALEDIVLDLFGEASVSGAILVGSDSPLMITSRTFNNAASGTFGQFVPGLSVGAALGQGDQARLIQLTRNDDFRTNIGFANATGEPLSVTVDLRRSNGARIAQATYPVEPYGYFQKTDIIGVDIDDAYAIVSSDTAGARYFTYASVVDNNSNDPVFVLPSESIGTSGAYVAAVARVGGTGGTNWRTDLEVHNPGTTQVSFEVEFLVRNQGNTNPVSETFSLTPGRSARFNDCLQSIFAMSMGAGALRIMPHSGTIMVSTRTYNDVPEGTFGQFIPGVDEESSGIAAGQKGRLIQLSDSRDYRTNIGFVNVSGSTTAVDLKLFDGIGLELGSLSFDLAPYETILESGIYGQVTNADVENGFAEVSTSSAEGRFIAYASVVDNRSGDPVYMGASVAGQGTAPQPPVTAPNLGIGETNSTSIALSWSAVSSATGYKLFRGSQQIFSGAGQSFTDTGLTSNTQYCYRVRAYNGAGDGPLSAQVCGTTTSSPPSSAPSLSVTGTTESSIALSWSAVGGATGYTLVRGQSIIYSGSGSTFTDIGRSPETQYCYRVRAFNGQGDGPWSSEACGTTDAAGPPSQITIDLPGGVTMDLVYIPAGTFMMGSPINERSRGFDEDLHQVTLNHGYFIGKTEVTQAQWEALMGSNPAHDYGVGDDYPVYYVSWRDICGGSTGNDCLAHSFIGQLNSLLGTNAFRLPTEAEWERAARGGTQTVFSFDTNSNPNWDTGCGPFPEAEPFMVWCGNASGRAKPVGSKSPNQFGLHDMHGNLFELVSDWYAYELGTNAEVDPMGPISGSFRVRRGGAWYNESQVCRSANRSYSPPDRGDYYVGFRLARSE